MGKRNTEEEEKNNETEVGTKGERARVEQTERSIRRTCSNCLLIQITNKSRTTEGKRTKKRGTEGSGKQKE